jgi:hypothetical protein
MLAMIKLRVLVGRSAILAGLQEDGVTAHQV